MSSEMAREPAAKYHSKPDFYIVDDKVDFDPAGYPSEVAYEKQNHDQH